MSLLSVDVLEEKFDELLQRRVYVQNGCENAKVTHFIN